MKMIALVGTFSALCGLIVVPVCAWRVWRWRRLERRRAMFRSLADELGLTCLHPAAAGDGPVLHTGPAEVDAHVGGRLQDMRVDIYERMRLERAQGLPTEVQTVVEIGGLDSPLPIFRLMPADAHDRAIHKVLGTSKITISGNAGFRTNNTLTGRDKTRIRALFEGGVAELLKDNTNLWVESTGESLHFSRYEKLLQANEIKGLLAKALEVAEAVGTAAAEHDISGEPEEEPEAPPPQNGDGFLGWWETEA